MFRNTKLSYGLIAIASHWLSAVAVIGLFAMGVWMVELTYYSPWYKTAPHWHKSVHQSKIISHGKRLLPRLPMARFTSYYC